MQGSTIKLHVGPTRVARGITPMFFGETDFVQNIMDIYRNFVIQYVVQYLSKI